MFTGSYYVMEKLRFVSVTKIKYHVFENYFTKQSKLNDRIMLQLLKVTRGVFKTSKQFM